MDTIHETLYGFLHASQAYQIPTQKKKKKKTHTHLDYIIQKSHVSLLNVGLFEHDFIASLITVITDIVNCSVFWHHCQNLSCWTVNQLLKY
jgi:hypothetical protein